MPLADDEDEDEAPEAAGAKRATICQSAIDLKEDSELPADEAISAKRNQRRKSTPWTKPGDAKPLGDDEDDIEELGNVGTKSATICQAAIDLKHSSEDAAEDAVVVKRSRQRRSTPWIKPGDAVPLDDEDDKESEVDGPKRATICQTAIEYKQTSEVDAAEETVPASRKPQRKSTPWTKPGQVQSLDDEDEGDDSEVDQDAGVAAKRATISRQAIELKEAAGANADESDAAGEVALVRRHQRKSTPWIKPGDAKPVAERSPLSFWSFHYCCSQANQEVVESDLSP